MFRIVRPIAATLIALLVLFFFVRPMYADLTAVQDDVAEYDDVLADAEEFNQLLNSLYAKQNSFSALERERLDFLVPDKIDEIRILVDLEALAKREGLLFRDINSTLEESEQDRAAPDKRQTNVSVAEDEFDGRLESRDVTFTVSGTYRQFRAFLRQVEQSLILMEIVKIDFTSAADTALWDYNVTVRIFGLQSMDEE